jgi:lysyl-tRNA synthetase class 2
LSLPRDARRSLLVSRARMVASCHAFFESRGFTHVETPTLVPCPGLDVHLDAFETNARSAARYLVTSPEYQMKRLLTQGMPRIYQIGHAYRRGELGSRHNPEFTILEFYRAHSGQDEIMRDTEQLVARITQGRVVLGDRTIDTRPPFARMTVHQAYEQYAGVDETEMLRLANEDEDTFYRLLVDKVEPGLATLPHAVFLHEYPSTQASLARRKPGDPRYAERFELYVAGVELCNGFGELTDPDEQQARFLADQAERARRGLPVYPMDERFLAALREGMPASGGNAIGLDRLIALSCGTTEIAHVMTFTDETV